MCTLTLRKQNAMNFSQQCLVFSIFILLWTLNSEAARVKHSKYKPNSWVPEDDQADWPSPDQLYFGLGADLEDEIILPGGYDYRNGSIMKNTRFQSKFGVVIYPESTSDIQKIILFAKDYGIRPTVYSSGHCFLGRSARDHTININMARMRQMEVNMNDPRSDTRMTITVGTGRAWREIYEEADKHKAIALGGSSPLVTPGGYILGGGHSPITRMKGLGVDQVVAFEMVTANGSIVRMTEEGGVIENPNGSTGEVTDSDLWWAVLGGGGGVYGVVTQFVLKLHPPPDGFVEFYTKFPIEDSDNCVGVATQALDIFLNLVRTNLTSNWGGYIGTRKSLTEPGKKHLDFFMNHWGKDKEKAMSILQDLVNFRSDCQQPSDVEVFDTFWEYQQKIDDTVWVRLHQIGTNLHEEDLVLGSGVAPMMVDFVTNPALAKYFTGFTGNLVGGNARNMPQDATSASPEFRNGLVSLVCYAGWYSPANDEEVISEVVRYGNERMYQYGTGVYYNENDYYLQNWQVEYWGSMKKYQRLLDVQKRWDPDNMFWCHHCVGSEVADTKPNGCPRSLHFEIKYLWYIVLLLSYLLRM